jgi:hypothetical protein
LSLANYCFTYNSLGFRARLRFCDAQSGHKLPKLAVLTGERDPSGDEKRVSVDSVARFQGKSSFDVVDGVVGDSGEHFEQIAKWVENVEFGGADQAVDGRSTFTASIRSSAHARLARCDDAQRSCCGIVVDLD